MFDKELAGARQSPLKSIRTGCPIGRWAARNKLPPRHFANHALGSEIRVPADGPDEVRRRGHGYADLRDLVPKRVRRQPHLMSQHDVCQAAFSRGHSHAELMNAHPERYAVLSRGRSHMIRRRFSAACRCRSGLSLSRQADKVELNRIRYVPRSVLDLHAFDMACCGFCGHEDKIVTMELESGYDGTEVQPRGQDRGDKAGDRAGRCGCPGVPGSGPGRERAAAVDA